MPSKAGRPCGVGTEVTAYPDRGCLSASKYIYQFHAPIQEKIIEHFGDCEVRAFRFSQQVTSAKDLLKIKKKNGFHADIIVHGFTTIVYFTESAEEPLRRLLDGFNQRLYGAGYDSVAYLPAEKLRCDVCPTRYLKKCSEVGVP